MRVLIAGGGVLGEAVAKILKAQGAHVTVVDVRREACARLARRLDIDVVDGDASDPATLEEARVEEASVFLALTDDDSINTISALLAKHYGVPRIIARIEDPSYARICEANGVETISFVDSASMMLEAMLYHNKLVELTSLIEEEGLDIEYVEYHGTSGRLKLKRNEAYPILVLRRGEVLLPSKDLKLEDGDKVFIIRRRRRLFAIPEF